MNLLIRGSRPRPRVALVGGFKDKDFKTFESIFPTLWIFSNFSLLEQTTAINELDLIIIDDYKSEPYLYSNYYLDRTHVICFTDKIEWLPGPIKNSKIIISEYSLSEEFLLPDINLFLHRQREEDFKNLQTIKGWGLIKLKIPHPHSREEFEKASKMLKDNAVVMTSDSKTSLSEIYNREGSNLGVAWLPNEIFNRAKWVERICVEWGKIDPVTFKNIGDWATKEDWMIPEEVNILNEINNLKTQKEKSNSEYENKINQCFSRYLKIKKDTDESYRKLISSQGKDLVEIVCEILKLFGFKVTKMDEQLAPEKPKKEDLRISFTNDTGINWEAIVEVRGYSKSTGTTADIQRLYRFSNQYLKENEKNPDKIIYIINGQIEMPPQQRQTPFESSPDDIEVFGENNGLIISTIVIFNILKLFLSKKILGKDLRKLIEKSSSILDESKINSIEIN